MTQHGSAAPRGPARRAAKIAAYAVRPKYTAGSLVYAHSSDGRVLLAQQRLRDRSAWGLPGGFTRSGEPLHVTAARELSEETTVAAAIGPEHLIAMYKQPWARHIDALYFIRLDPVSAAKNSLEIKEAGWFHEHDLPDPLTAETSLALDHLRLNGLLPHDKTRRSD